MGGFQEQHWLSVPLLPLPGVLGWGGPHLLESSPLHFQVQEPGLSPGGSWNESRPQPVPVLPPKLCVHLLLPKARSKLLCMFQVSPGYPALRAESGWRSLFKKKTKQVFSFLVVLSRSPPIPLGRADVNAGDRAEWGGEDSTTDPAMA